MRRLLSLVKKKSTKSAYATSLPHFQLLPLCLKMNCLTGAERSSDGQRPFRCPAAPVPKLLINLPPPRSHLLRKTSAAVYKMSSRRVLRPVLYSLRQFAGPATAGLRPYTIAAARPLLVQTAPPALRPGAAAASCIGKREYSQQAQSKIWSFEDVR